MVVSCGYILFFLFRVRGEVTFFLGWVAFVKFVTEFRFCNLVGVGGFLVFIKVVVSGV